MFKTLWSSILTWIGWSWLYFSKSFCPLAIINIHFTFACFTNIWNWNFLYFFVNCFCFLSTNIFQSIFFSLKLYSDIARNGTYVIFFFFLSKQIKETEIEINVFNSLINEFGTKLLLSYRGNCLEGFFFFRQLESDFF